MTPSTRTLILRAQRARAAYEDLCVMLDANWTPELAARAEEAHARWQAARAKAGVAAANEAGAGL